ncbi:helix-turn-helix transcriptional regulator [Lentzea sp.]|uniref:helix-turn-helix transcriptional regulator n=1 Tax=Lentzea sp. TaxID=56099 RepID=UPI002B5F78C9|nr:LuxR C-terminal-related transcriptional regulator [Lentzea sp.]HUQ55894.1 LuxR C-terminal-related transcriptional regulator [Lentzea sp.]
MNTVVALGTAPPALPAMRFASGESHATCHATTALTLVRAGTDRPAAIRYAEASLDDPGCAAHVSCTWTSLITLLAAAAPHALDARLHELERSSHLAERVGGEVVVELLRARCDFLLGQQDRARTVLTRVVADRATAPDLRCLALAWLTHNLVAAKQHTAARRLLEEHDIERLLARRTAYRPQLLMARGAMHTGAGRFARGIEDFQEAGRALMAAGVHNPALVTWRPPIVKAALRLGNRDLATRMATEELVAARRWGSPHAVGTALHTISLVTGSDADLEDSISLMELGGTHHLLPEALLDLGGRLVAAGSPAARPRLERAVQVAALMGHHHLVDEAQRVLGRLASTADAKLSGQETRVLSLAQAGCTNKQIAAKLCLTVRGVEFHLSSCYRKLGLSGRRDLAVLRIAT